VTGYQEKQTAHLSWSNSKYKVTERKAQNH